MIIFKHIERTALEEEALSKLIRKHTSTQKDILVVFDKRMKDTYGSYIWNSEKNLHEIRISPVKFEYKDRTYKIYEMISTIIHECKHLQQREDLGHQTFNSKKFGCNRDIKHKEASELYSQCEVEARIYEAKNVLESVDFYYQHCKSP